MNNLTIRTTDEEGIDHYRPLFSAQLYTGCKDTEGLGIYVDDIVASTNLRPSNYIVRIGEYVHGDASHVGFYIEDTATDYQYPIKNACRWVRVIGNINDNPGLIE